MVTFLQGQSGSSASAGPDIVAGVLVIALMGQKPAGAVSLFFRSLRGEGLTVLVVGQYVEVALSFVDRAYVLDKGAVALEGPAAELASSSELIDTYLAVQPEEIAS